jgi:hypothetical protein
MRALVNAPSHDDRITSAYVDEPVATPDETGDGTHRIRRRTATPGSREVLDRPAQFRRARLTDSGGASSPPLRGRRRRLPIENQRTRQAISPFG